MAEPSRELKRQQTTSRRALIGEDGEEIVKPGCFTRNVLKCPCAIMWITFFVAVIISALPLVSGRIIVVPDDFAGFDSDTLPEMRDYHTWTAIFESGGIYEDTSGEAKGDDGTDYPVNFYYSALNSNSNMFDVSAVEAMIEAETKLLEMPDWATFCTKVSNSNNASDTRCAAPQSLLRYLMTNDALEKKQCEAGFCYMAAANLAACVDYGVFPCSSSIYDWRDGELADEADWSALLAKRVCNNLGMGAYAKTLLLDKAADCELPSSKYVRSMYQVHSPFNDTETCPTCPFVEDEPGKTFVKSMAEVLDESRDAVSATKSTASAMSTSGKDVNMWWSAAWTHYPDTTILLFTDLALSGISFALIFIIVLLNTASLVLTLAGVFEILVSLPLAMFLWMICLQTTISTFELLGLFLILCIGADDIFVFTDTWKESAVMSPSISGSLQTRFTWTYNRAAGAMLTTTATTAFCLLLNATAPFPMLKTFGIFNAFVVIADYVMVITWYAVTTVSLARLADKFCPPGDNWECSCCCPGKKDANKERKATAFFKDKLAPLTYKLRWVLITLSSLLLIGGIAAAALLFSDAQSETWVEGHQIRELAMIQSDKFGDPDDGKIPVTLIYGMSGTPVEFPKSPDLFQSVRDPDYLKKFVAKYSPSFTFGPEQQKKMVADCEALRSNTEIVANSQAYCLLSDLKAEAPGAFPYQDEKLLRTALADFYSSAKYAQLKNDYSNYETLTGFVSDGDTGVKALWHSFNTTMPPDITISGSGLVKYYEPWRDAVDGQCDDVAPCVFTQPYQFFYFMSALLGLERAAVQNILIALAAAYIVLCIVTTNLLVPFLAVLSIGATVTWVLAFAFLIGFKFDSNVAILIVMVVGMAVDYAVHLSHFYNEAHGSRYEKATEALYGVGLSVVGGAVTTAGAAIPLCAVPNFMFLQQAGVFILMVAIFGVLFSFFMLVPLFMVCGPEGETGDVKAIIRRCRAQIAKSEAKARTQARTQA